MPSYRAREPIPMDSHAGQGGKSENEGMQVGVPWEPLMLELSCFRRLWICIGESHIPIHMGREVILH